MSEITELFNELLFGSGALIGLILIFAISVLVSWKVKFSSPFFMVILIFLAMDHLEHVTSTTMHAWYFIISLMGIALLGYIFLRDFLRNTKR